ncbi:hypothetical protein K503DRAFT_615115 [Rhizopogon vinicolor AM-OR11-026]|uniref:Uncharacterized protein n=1 Tax=Rhizopogon vinicolor AM-OR11-026 TaxID=1314800 RepID=A0A1B7MIG9_9AGAM|nr:hypothetical protein K503DRAFT_615115 [Rhizopogon vinicolor AM-OR11-026]
MHNIGTTNLWQSIPKGGATVGLQLGFATAAVQHMASLVSVPSRYTPAGSSLPYSAYLFSLQLLSLLLLFLLP